MNMQETDPPRERQRSGKLLLGFAGEADNHVRRQLDVRDCRAQTGNRRLRLICVVATVHPGKRGTASALHREMEVRRQRRQGGDNLHKARRHDRGVKRSQPHPSDAGQRIHRT